MRLIFRYIACDLRSDRRSESSASTLVSTMTSGSTIKLDALRDLMGGVLSHLGAEPGDFAQLKSDLSKALEDVDAMRQDVDSAGECIFDMYELLQSSILGCITGDEAKSLFQRNLNACFEGDEEASEKSMSELMRPALQIMLKALEKHGVVCQLSDMQATEEDARNEDAVSQRLNRIYSCVEQIRTLTTQKKIEKVVEKINGLASKLETALGDTQAMRRDVDLSGGCIFDMYTILKSIAEIGKSVERKAIINKKLGEIFSEQEAAGASIVEMMKPVLACLRPHLSGSEAETPGRLRSGVLPQQSGVDVHLWQTGVAHVFGNCDVGVYGSRSPSPTIPRQEGEPVGFSPPGNGVGNTAKQADEGLTQSLLGKRQIVQDNQDHEPKSGCPCSCVVQ